MEDFAFFSLLIEKRNENGTWRDRMVWYTTPKTKIRHKIKVKSLPKNMQYKYAPLEVRRRHYGMTAKLPLPPSTEPVPTQKPKRTFILYYSADRLEGSYDKFTDGKLVMATDDSQKAMDIEASGHKVAVAHLVPIQAFIKYWDYEKSDWITFPKDIDDEKKFELINWSNFDVFLVDFFKYKDQMDFRLSDPESDLENKENE